MWLPTPVYEALPWLYVAIGVAFLGGIAYLGFDAAFSPLYVAIGLASILSGIFVHLRRQQYRKSRDEADPHESASV